MMYKWFAPQFLLPFLSLFATICPAQSTQPAAIFDHVLAQYKSMNAYSSEGTITEDVNAGGVKTTLQTTFSIKMKKPNQYLITWNQINAVVPAFSQAGAVWNQGSQPYLYMAGLKAYSKITGDDFALGSATGISGGAAFTIPTLFLTTLKNYPTPFSRLINPQIEAGERIDGDDCYVISGSSTVSKNESFWISKATYMIKKYSRSLDPPAGGFKITQMTDQQLDDAIKASGQEVTDATRQQMRDMIKKADQNMQTANLSGSSTEVQLKISSPDLKDADFAFNVPPDAVLKDSLFGPATNAK
jgi:hypothetical protein